MDSSSELQLWIERLKAGDPSARDMLLQCAQERLRKLVWKMRKGFAGVNRWEDVDDVLQEATVKLWKALKEVLPGSVKEFIGLAATQIRRVLIDLARHYYGPEGPGRKHYTPPPEVGPPDPSDSSHDERKLAAWSALHEQVALLPDKERDVFDLHWYQGLTLQETAQVLGVSVDTVKRRWQSARLSLFQALKGELPEV
jgi:RNA polymerase sigma-70 factor (ECF subfamily)